MSDRRLLTAVLVGAGLVVLVTLTVLGAAWLGKDREFLASVPQPPPLERTVTVPVAPGDSACLADATVLPSSEVAQVRIGTRGEPAVPLTLSVTGPAGYRSTTRVAPTWENNALVDMRLRPPARPVHGRVCLRNDGRRVVDLYAADDRAETISRTFVAGRRVPANFVLRFAEADRTTIGDRLGGILDELSVFRPGFVGPWLLWPLTILVVLSVPLGIVGALWLALREDEP
jgi:hypothetical protein